MWIWRCTDISPEDGSTNTGQLRNIWFNWRALQSNIFNPRQQIREDSSRLQTKHVAGRYGMSKYCPLKWKIVHQRYTASVFVSGFPPRGSWIGSCESSSGQESLKHIVKRELSLWVFLVYERGFRLGRRTWSSTTCLLTSTGVQTAHGRSGGRLFVLWGRLHRTWEEEQSVPRPGESRGGVCSLFPCP